MKARIDRSVEVVQILLFLSEQQDKTYQCTNNRPYTAAISQWFAPYKDHSSVKLTRQLVQTKHFFHIEPLRAILSLDSIITDAYHPLYDWSIAVNEFITTSQFDAFFESQQPYYTWILEHINTLDTDTWINFIENYFKQKPDEFHLIICPLAGNYGFTMEQKNKSISYTVRFAPKYDENGNHSWNFDFFAKGVAHEYAHCFVNPTVDANKETLSEHRDFFESHKNIPNFYNTNYAIINEYFVRAFQIRFMELNKSLFPDFNIVEEYELQKKSFIYIDRFLDALKKFEVCSKSFYEFYNEHIDCILS